MRHSWKDTLIGVVEVQDAYQCAGCGTRLLNYPTDPRGGSSGIAGSECPKPPPLHAHDFSAHDGGMVCAHCEYEPAPSGPIKWECPWGATETDPDA